MNEKIDEYRDTLERSSRWYPFTFGVIFSDTRIIEVIGIQGLRALKEAKVLIKSNLKGPRQYYVYEPKTKTRS